MTGPRPSSRTKVLYIGGEGRSGSTVLERLLASSPDTCAVGEVKYLFQRGIGNAELCGCGKPVPECELWSEVGSSFCGGWDTPRGRELVEFFTALDRPSNLPMLVRGRSQTVRRARGILAELYPLIAEVSGASVLIDSSKHPGWAHLLAGTEAVDLRVVHLVRHPSAVVSSWSRPVARPQAEVGTGEATIPAQRPAEVAFRWHVFNRLFHRLARHGVPTVLVRYEDYPGDVESTVRACLGLVGASYESGRLALAGGHGIAGNPSRFADKEVQVRVDDRWVLDMPATRHLVASALSWPLRRDYGYRIRRSMPVRPLLRHAPGRYAPGPYAGATSPPG